MLKAKTIFPLVETSIVNQFHRLSFAGSRKEAVIAIPISLQRKNGRNFDSLDFELSVEEGNY